MGINARARRDGLVYLVLAVGGAAGALVNAAAYAVGGALAGGSGPPSAAHGPEHHAGPVPAIRMRWVWDRRGFAIGLAGGSAIGLTHLAALRLHRGRHRGRYGASALLRSPVPAGRRDALRHRP